MVTILIALALMFNMSPTEAVDLPMDSPSVAQALEVSAWESFDSIPALAPRVSQNTMVEYVMSLPSTEADNIDPTEFAVVDMYDDHIVHVFMVTPIWRA